MLWRVSPDRTVKSIESIVPHNVRIQSGRYERVGAHCASAESGCVERVESIIVHDVRICAALQQQMYGMYMALEDTLKQWRVARRSADVNRTRWKGGNSRID